MDRYAETAARLVGAGRLNKWYPDPEGCAAYLRALSASFREGVYDGVTIDLGSGMPALRELAAVQADGELAASFLSEQAARRDAGRPETARLAAKNRYYKRLSGLRLPPLFSLDVRLRRVDVERGAAAFEVVFDRYDAADNVFARYTLLLEQRDVAFGDALIERTGDYSIQTSKLRETMERYASDESELAFLLLGREPGVRLEEITRARVGPLWCAATGAPAGWLPDGPARDAEFVLHLPFDRASIDLDADRDQDPFATIYRQFLSAETRPLVEEQARKLGYRVQKERKFACTPGAACVLRGKLAAAKTTNVVYVA